MRKGKKGGEGGFVSICYTPMTPSLGATLGENKNDKKNIGSSKKIPHKKATNAKKRGDNFSRNVS